MASGPPRPLPNALIKRTLHYMCLPNIWRHVLVLFMYDFADYASPTLLLLFFINNLIDCYLEKILSHVFSMANERRQGYSTWTHLPIVWKHFFFYIWPYNGISIDSDLSCVLTCSFIGLNCNVFRNAPI